MTHKKTAVQQKDRDFTSFKNNNNTVYKRVGKSVKKANRCILVVLVLICGLLMYYRQCIYSS